MAAPAGAVTITEFPLGGAPGAHLPRYIKAGPEGNLWFSDGGTSGGIGRISPTGELFGEIGGHFPDDLAFAPDGTLFWAGDTGIGRREPDGAIVERDVNTEFLAPYAVAVNYKGFLAWSEAMNGGTPMVCEGEAFAAEPLVQCGQPGGAPRGTHHRPRVRPRKKAVGGASREQHGPPPRRIRTPRRTALGL